MSNLIQVQAIADTFSQIADNNLLLRRMVDDLVAQLRAGTDAGAGFASWAMEPEVAAVIRRRQLETDIAKLAGLCPQASPEFTAMLSAIERVQVASIELTNAARVASRIAATIAKQA